MLTDCAWIDYPKELQSPHRLTKFEVAEHLQQYAANFHLNIMLSTTVRSTAYNPIKKQWTCKVQTQGRSGIKTIVSKHLVQATGIGSGTPRLPLIENENVYRGMSLHSTQYRNAQQLADHGIKVCGIFPVLSVVSNSR